MSAPTVPEEIRSRGANFPKIIFLDFLIFYLNLVVITPVFGILFASGINTVDYVIVALLVLFIPSIVGILLKRRVLWYRPIFLLISIVTDVMAFVSVIGAILGDSDVAFLRVSIYFAIGCMIGALTCIDVANRPLEGSEKRRISERQWPFVMMLVITCGVFTPAITGGDIETNLWFLIGTQFAFALLLGWIFKLRHATHNNNLVMNVIPEFQKKRPGVLLRGFATFIYRVTLLLFFACTLLMIVISRETFRTILKVSPFTFTDAIYPLSIAFYVIIGIGVALFAFNGKSNKNGGARESGRFHKGRFLVILYVIVIAAGVGTGYGIYLFSAIIGWVWVAFIAQVGLLAVVFALLLTISNRFIWMK